jgi:hypothetical protein
MECINNRFPCDDVECESLNCLNARTHICEDVECEEPQCQAYREELKRLEGDPWLR